MSSETMAELEAGLYDCRNTSEIRLLRKWLDLRYSAAKELLVDDDTPELRGRAQELRGVLRLFREQEVLDTQGNMGYLGGT